MVTDARGVGTFTLLLLYGEPYCLVSSFYSENLLVHKCLSSLCVATYLALNTMSTYLPRIVNIFGKKHCSVVDVAVLSQRL